MPVVGVTTLVDGLRGAPGTDARRADQGGIAPAEPTEGKVFMLKRFIVILAAMAMVASACGSDDDDTPAAAPAT